jgi:hypothetical protein
VIDDTQIGVIFVDGQRCEVLVRSESAEDGTWHNALVFRRDGRMSGKEMLMVGMEWHLPPVDAVEQAVDLSESEVMDLFRKAARPRSPLM